MLTVNRLRLLIERAPAPPVDELHVLLTDPVDEGTASMGTDIEVTFDASIEVTTLTPLTFIVTRDDTLLLTSTQPEDESETATVDEDIILTFDHVIDELTVDDETILVEYNDGE